jgi:hypothetical protein
MNLDTPNLPEPSQNTKARLPPSLGIMATRRLIVPEETRAVRPRPVADLTFAISLNLALSKDHATMRLLEILLINLISYFINSGDLNAPNLINC